MVVFKESQLRYEDHLPIYVLMNLCDEAGDMTAGLHWHDYYELLYIMSGHGEQVLGETRTPVDRGDIVLIEPGVTHTTYAVNPEGCYIMVILFFLPGAGYESIAALRSEYMLPFMNLGGGVRGVVYNPDQSLGDMHRLVSAMCEEFTLKSPGHELVILGMLYEMLGYMIREGKLRASAHVPEDQLRTVAKACEYIERHAGDALKLSDVAREVGFSNEYFSRLFKRVSGQNFKRYCDYVRMSEAEKLILTEKLSVTQAAMRVGFDDPSNFVRMFKRVMGVTPRVFKQRKRA